MSEERGGGEQRSRIRRCAIVGHTRCRRRATALTLHLRERSSRTGSCQLLSYLRPDPRSTRRAVAGEPSPPDLSEGHASGPPRQDSSLERVVDLQVRRRSASETHRHHEVVETVLVPARKGADRYDSIPRRSAFSRTGEPAKRGGTQGQARELDETGAREGGGRGERTACRPPHTLA